MKKKRKKLSRKEMNQQWKKEESQLQNIKLKSHYFSMLEFHISERPLSKQQRSLLSSVKYHFCSCLNSPLFNKVHHFRTQLNYFTTSISAIYPKRERWRETERERFHANAFRNSRILSHEIFMFISFPKKK